MPKYRDSDGNEIGVLKAGGFQALHPKKFREANPTENYRRPGQQTDAGSTNLVEGLHKKAQEALKQNLADGEKVLVVVNGPHSAAMIATDRRVFIFKTGAAAGATFGSKFTSFDYRNISGVQLHTGAMSGSAVLDVAGAAPVGTSYWGNKDNDPWKAQNAIPIMRAREAQTEIARLRELARVVQ